MTKPDFSFDWTISPTTPDDFFTNTFEKKHMVIRRNDPSYYQSLLSFADIDTVVSTMGLSVPEIQVTKAGSGITPPDYSYDSGFIDPVRVSQLFAGGATVILSGLHERLPKLAQYCRALEHALSSRVQTNIYMTPPGSQGFNAHYDNHDVIVLQVEGTKEWRIYDTPVELPLNTQAFDPHNVEVGAETDRFVLEPGDMCYVPRGVAHDAVATDQVSLHITTGLMMRTWADLMVEAVNIMAHEDPAFRRALPPGLANSDFDASAHLGTFQDLMQRLVEKAPAGKLLDSFKMDFLNNRMPRVPGQMTQVARLETLTTTSQVGARPHLIFDVVRHVDDATQISIICQGAEVMLPAFTEPSVRHCLTTPEFVLADMPGELDDAGKLVLVKRLVREGMMQAL